MASDVAHYIQQGAALHLEGDREGARQAYLTALELEPENSTARNNLGFSE